jgi:DnaJ-class molecular chaperone
LSLQTVEEERGFGGNTTIKYPVCRTAEGKGLIQEKQMRAALIRRKDVTENKCKIGVTGTAAELSQQNSSRSHGEGRSSTGRTLKPDDTGRQ